MRNGKSESSRLVVWFRRWIDRCSETLVRPVNQGFNISPGQIHPSQRPPTGFLTNSERGSQQVAMYSNLRGNGQRQLTTAVKSRQQSALECYLLAKIRIIQRTYYRSYLLIVTANLYSQYALCRSR